MEDGILMGKLRFEEGVLSAESWTINMAVLKRKERCGVNIRMTDVGLIENEEILFCR